MDERIAMVLLIVSAVLCAALGGLVILRSPHKRTHRTFAVLAFILALWAVGVTCVINTHSERWAQFFLRATFVVACLIPLSYHLFVGFFPRQRYEGFRPLLWFLCGITPILVVLGAATPLYVTAIHVFPDQRPSVEYGPLFFIFAVCVVATMVFSYPTLFQKLKTARGIERRQIEHVILGIALSTTCATLTNVVAPILKLGSFEIYGPIFIVLMVGVFAYAMIRYHLLDIRVIVSRTTVYAISTAFIVVTFLGMISLVHLAFSEGGRVTTILPTVLAALVIAFVLQPLKERVQLVLDQTLLKRRYDTNLVFARISQNVSRMVQLDQLLDRLAKDIRDTLGVHVVRVLLLAEESPSELVIEYSTQADEIGRHTRKHGSLIEYAGSHPNPVLLEELLHARPTPRRVEIANHLAELDAYCCLPLRTKSGLVGILTLGQKASGDMYSRNDLVLFNALAGPLATAIENARLYRKLEELNMHLASILTNMRGGVIAVDTEGKVRTVNEGAGALFGPITLGQELESLPGTIAGVLRQTLKNRRGITDFETLIPGPDNTRTPVVISSACLTTADDTHTGAMAMIYDLTQIKRLEQNVRRADRLSSIGTLAAGMAHEIKNPLVSIKTFTQLLLDRYSDSDFRATFCEVVPHEVERINAIVTRLLDFARPKPVSFATQDLRAIVTHVLALIENETQKGRIAVEVDLPETPVQVYGNEQQLHQVFLNLALNAIEAMAQAEQRTLSVGVTRARMHLRHDVLAPYLETECARVTVSDTGCGIPSRDVDRIFTPFYSTKASGCGLGLSVVHGIVGEHGGEMDVTSTPSKGTVFTISLPLANTMAPVGNVG